MAEATSVSGSAPLAVTERPCSESRTETSACASVPSVTAKGADPDTLVASAKAYLAALNKLVARRLRGGEAIAVGERRIHSTDVG